MMKVLFISLMLSGFISCAKLPLEKIKKNDNDFRVVWVKNLDPVYNTGNLPIGTSSPFVFEDILYMGDLTGHMSAYDFESGRIIWQVNDEKPLQAQANKLDDNIYYGSKTGRLFVRNYATGKLAYSIDLGAPIESQPIFSKGRAFLHLRNHTIICLDAKTGKIFWRYKRSIPYSTTLQRVSKVLPFENKLIVGFADGHVVALTIEEGVPSWEQKVSTGVKFIDVDVRPIIFNKYIAVGSASGPMRLLNPVNGVIEKTLELTQSHTPLLVNDGFYVGDVFGEVYFVDKYGKIAKRMKISENGISSIAHYKQGIAVATMGQKIFYLSKDDLSVQSSFNLGSDQSAVFGDVYSNNSYLGVYSSRNRLYVLK